MNKKLGDQVSIDQIYSQIFEFSDSVPGNSYQIQFQNCYVCKTKDCPHYDREKKILIKNVFILDQSDQQSYHGTAGDTYLNVKDLIISLYQSEHNIKKKKCINCGKHRFTKANIIQFPLVLVVCLSYTLNDNGSSIIRVKDIEETLEFLHNNENIKYKLTAVAIHHLNVEGGVHHFTAKLFNHFNPEENIKIFNYDGIYQRGILTNNFDNNINCIRTQGKISTPKLLFYTRQDT
jgi:hypothetical protein